MASGVRPGQGTNSVPLSMHLTAKPLTAVALGALGEVLVAPLQSGRSYFDALLSNDRVSGRPSLSIVHSLPVASLPLEVKQLERHQFSSQSFVPMCAGRWLLIVCPSATDGGPDVAAVQAFVARPDQGITLRRDTWHHSLTVLDQSACHAVFMWRDGTQADEEFRQVAPFSVEVPPFLKTT